MNINNALNHALEQDKKNKMSTLQISRAASLWYPVMLTEASGEISEAKAAELLSLDIIAYRGHKEAVMMSVMMLVKVSTSPLRSVVEIMKAKPELFE